MSRLLQNRELDILNYLRRKSFPKNVAEYFFNSNFFRKNDFPSAYTHYPEMFSKAFSDNFNEETLTHLNIAGYLYFRYMILIDRIIDNNEDDALSIEISKICESESVSILLKLFSENSVFWKYWNKRKDEYLLSVKIDQNQEIELTLDLFETLSDFRSAFGKIAIDSCLVASESNNKEIHTKLLASHKYFSVGFQIIDDIQDFKSDHKKNQKNICSIFLKEKLRDKGIVIHSLNVETQYKYLYAYGIIEELLHLSRTYFTKAKNEINSLDTKLDHWINLIDLKDQEAKIFLLQLNAYEKSLIASKYLSNLKVASTQTVEDILYGSFDFVSSLQNENGSWEEFYLNSGLSNVWATGYVLFTLPKLEYRKDEHHKAACTFLLENRQKELWGYNTEWIPDTDSTTCVILGLHCNGIDISSFVDKWVTWQHKIGGFSTYSCQDDLRKIILTENNDFNGWLQPHTCVSAVAYYFLSLYKRTSVEFKQLESFLLQKLKNGVDSYWWTSPLYSCYYVIKGLNNSKSKNYYNLKQIISGIVARQNPDGSYGDAYQFSNSFYTSMLLSLLCSDNEIFYKFKKEAEKAFLWLANNQYSDGSFSESTCLQVPSPEVLNPKDIKNWKLGHTKTNIVTKDFSRLFSSVQSCNAINQYSLLC